ncbi:MAG: ribosome maturation factor RimM, partial [Alphaproteobacteria bacterium]
MRAPFGVQGLVRIGAYTENPEDLVAYGPLHAGPGGPLVALAIVRIEAGVPIGRITGVDDRIAAERLRGTLLCVPRAALPVAPAGAYYHHDLIGLAVQTTAGAPLGRVAAVHYHGAGA